MSNSTSSTTTSFSVISPQSYLSPKHFLGDLFSHNLYDKLTTLHFWYDYICRFRVSNTFGFENKLQNHWHEGFSESKFNANDSNQNPNKIFPTVLWSSHWLVDGIRFLFILPEAHSMSLCALSSNPKHVALLHLYRQQHIIMTAKLESTKNKKIERSMVCIIKCFEQFYVCTWING